MSRPRSTTRSEPLHQQVARQIRTDIAAGKLRDGERIPSTKELADQFGVSGYTISEAMRLLADEGLVRSHERSGRVVHAPDQGSYRDAAPTATPHVVLIGGYAGSGKTELGRILARETGWAMADKDTITRPVVEAALEIIGQESYDRESDDYLQKIRPREYEALSAAMHENLQCGNSIICTAPFIREFRDSAWLKRTSTDCAELGASLTYVWVDCDAATMLLHLRRRGAARDTWKLSNWDEYVSKLDFDFRPSAPHVVINNSQNSDPLPPQAKSLAAAAIDAEVGS